MRTVCGFGAFFDAPFGLCRVSRKEAIALFAIRSMDTLGELIAIFDLKLSIVPGSSGSRRVDGFEVILDLVTIGLIVILSSTVLDLRCWILWYDVGRIVTIIHPLLSCKLLRKTETKISTKMSC